MGDKDAETDDAEEEPATPKAPPKPKVPAKPEVRVTDSVDTDSGDRYRFCSSVQETMQEEYKRLFFANPLTTEFKQQWRAALATMNSESSAASIKAAKMGLTHKGFGKYVDAKGNHYISRKGTILKVGKNAAGKITHLEDSDTGVKTHVVHNGKMTSTKKVETARSKQHIKNTHAAIRAFKSDHRKDLKKFKALKIQHKNAQGKEKAKITREMNTILNRQREHIRNVSNHLNPLAKADKDAMIEKHGLKMFKEQ